MTYNEMQLAKQSAVDRIIASNERQVMYAFRKRRDEVLAVLQRNYAKYLVGVDKADYYSTLALYNRLQTMEQEIKGVYITLSKETSRSIIAGQMEAFDDAFYRSQYSTTFFADSIGADFGFSTVNPLVRDVAVTGDVELLKRIRDEKLRKMAQGMMPPTGTTLSSLLASNNATALAKVIKVVKQGLISGESYSKQVNKVKKVFNGNASNAARVIRTEGNRNLNAGSYYNSQDIAQKVPIKRRWQSTLDSKVRDSHASLDGVMEDENGLWWIGGDSARYPTDFSQASLSVNCRCTTIDVIEGLEPQLRRGVDPLTGKSDIGSYKNYDEWKKGGVTAKPIKEPKGIFKEATSIKEAEQFAKTNIGIKNPMYESADIKVANAMNRSAYDNFERFPELKKSVSDFGVAQNLEMGKLPKGMTLPDGAYGISYNVKNEAGDRLIQGIGINKNIASDTVKFQKQLDYGVKSKQLPEGCNTFKYVADHEMGHEIDKMLGGFSESDTFWKVIKKAEVSTELSGYAGSASALDTFVRETLAEGWAEYLNNPVPRALSKNIAESVIKEYDRKFKGI